MTSEAKRTANRRNSKASTGPRTSKGKAASCRNGLKHGLAGKGKALGPIDRALLLKRLPEFLQEFAPRTGNEHLLVHRLAVASIQMDSATRQIHHDQVHNIREADRRWDQERLDQVAFLVTRLELEPREVVVRLQRTSQGCAWMMDRWNELLDVMDEVGDWDEAQQATACRLSGVSMAHLNAETTDPVALALAELDRLEAVDKEVWELYEGPSFEEAESRAYWDHSPHGDLMRRYEKSAERLYFRTLGEIRQSKRGSASARGPKVGVSVYEEVARMLQAVSQESATPVPARSETRPSSPPPAPKPYPSPISAPQRVEAMAVAPAPSPPQRSEAKPEISSASALASVRSVVGPAEKPAPDEAKPTATSRPAGPSASKAVDPRRKQQDQARKARRAAKAARKKQRTRR